jgi:hypothetical protein
LRISARSKKAEVPKTKWNLNASLISNLCKRERERHPAKETWGGDGGGLGAKDLRLAGAMYRMGRNERD